MRTNRAASRSNNRTDSPPAPPSLGRTARSPGAAEVRLSARGLPGVEHCSVAVPARERPAPLNARCAGSGARSPRTHRPGARRRGPGLLRGVRRAGRFRSSIAHRASSSGKVAPASGSTGIVAGSFHRTTPNGCSEMPRRDEFAGFIGLGRGACGGRRLPHRRAGFSPEAQTGARRAGAVPSARKWRLPPDQRQETSVAGLNPCGVAQSPASVANLRCRPDRMSGRESNLTCGIKSPSLLPTGSYAPQKHTVPSKPVEPCRPPAARRSAGVPARTSCRS